MTTPQAAAPHDRPEVVYHYTDAVGLLGIISDRCLWATDADFLNDAQELRFGRSELHAALIEAAETLSPSGRGAEGDPNENRATIMRGAAGHLEPGGPYLHQPAHAAFVTCFCEADDLLSQWRGYGLSGGFAIGFQTAGLTSIRVPSDPDEMADFADMPEISRPQPDPIYLVKVRYGAEAIGPVVDHVLGRIAPQPRGHPGVSGYYRAKTILLPALATIKHPSFSEEREWRLVATASIGEPSVAFRTGPLGVIPYLRLPFTTDAITAVVVGPGENRGQRRQGVERLLAASGIEAGIRLSDVPFRA